MNNFEEAAEKHALSETGGAWPDFNNAKQSFLAGCEYAAKQIFCTCKPEEKHGETSAMHCNHCGKVEPSETWLKPLTP